MVDMEDGEEDEGPEGEDGDLGVEAAAAADPDAGTRMSRAGVAGDAASVSAGHDGSLVTLISAGPSSRSDEAGSISA